jgi:hypothetical protein
VYKKVIKSSLRLYIRFGLRIELGFDVHSSRRLRLGYFSFYILTSGGPFILCFEDGKTNGVKYVEKGVEEVEKSFTIR